MEDQKGNVKRCVWANPKNPLYIKYHDEEWGRPLHDDARLLELLTLPQPQSFPIRYPPTFGNEE